jgi:glucose/arabinose dehydrogenase
VPPDNPFVGRPGWKPQIYTLGHRNPEGLAFNPANGQLWSTEHGPQGGDELNVIRAGLNYGWPRVSFGRNYDGTQVGEGYALDGMEPPLLFWVPSIAPSGLMIYQGDKFPDWRGNAFVGALRWSFQQNSGHLQRLIFSEQGLPIGREPLLRELKQRIRDVREGPDGRLYVLTDEPEGVLLRIEPAT